MTKKEIIKCTKLMNKAIKTLKESKDLYQKSEEYLKNGNELEWETNQRKADQYYGYAEGINQVLVEIGFKHENMKILSNLL